MTTIKNSENQEIMTMDMVAEYLQLSKKTIYKMVSQKRIPMVKVGNRNRFIKEEIDGWLHNGATIPIDIPEFPKFNN